MMISLNWLTDYVDVLMPAAELADLLMRIGFCVDAIDQTEADIVFDVEVTSNRPDALGHIGLAREIAAVTGQALKLPNLDGIVTAGNVADDTRVDVEAPEFCPRYTARMIHGVRVCASPPWLVERLEAVGLRAINNVVDVTNYVLLEYSQPLHAFDFDKLAGGRIVVRWARDGERITAIDGSTHELREWMGIIADADRPVAVGGVMGGLDTEVADATTHVLIEAAQFDPLTIRKCSRALGLMSEASYRFERGVDPVAVERASLRACQLILQTGGGELRGGVVDVWAEPYRPPTVRLRPERCSQLLGIDVPAPRQVAILETLALQPTESDGAIACTVPPHRSDLSREVDLIEEVARIYGYDRIPTGGAVSHEVTPRARLESARKALGESLNGAGYHEAITFTFVDQAEGVLFGWPDSLTVDPRLRKRNGVLRQGLLPSLLRARKTNQDAGNENVNLFELSSVFPRLATAGGEDALPAEYTQVGLITDGSLQDLRGAVEAAVARFDPAAEVRVRPADVPGLTDGAAAELRLRPGGADADLPTPLGVMGQVSEKVRDHYGLTTAPTGAMLRFDLLAELGQTVRVFQPLPRFPAICRDLSIVVDESVTWEAVAQAVTGAAGELLAGLDYVGAYRGKQVGGGQKSMTMRATYRHPDRTLRHEEVDALIQAVVAELENKHNAQLRTA